MKTKLDVWEGLIQASHLKKVVKSGVDENMDNYIKIWKDLHSDGFSGVLR